MQDLTFDIFGWDAEAGQCSLVFSETPDDFAPLRLKFGLYNEGFEKSETLVSIEYDDSVVHYQRLEPLMDSFFGCIIAAEQFTVEWPDGRVVRTVPTETLVAVERIVKTVQDEFDDKTLQAIAAFFETDSRPDAEA